MAYYQNYQQQSDGGHREYAIDWEAKTIPLLAYKSCLVTKEAFLLSQRGVPDHVPKIAKARFMAAIVTFFDTVESGFTKYLNSETYTKNPEKIGEDTITTQDYEGLLLDTKLEAPQSKLFLLFRILKNWCFEHGPFQTFSENDKDVFERLEEEDAAL